MRWEKRLDVDRIFTSHWLVGGGMLVRTLATCDVSARARIDFGSVSKDEKGFLITTLIRFYNIDRPL